MKVLQVINSLHTGGAEKLLVDSLPLYKSKGVDVDLFLLCNHATPFSELLKESFTGRIIHSRYGSKSVYNPFHIIEIQKIIREYDLVHVHLFPALYWVAIARIFTSGSIPIVFTEHSTNNRRINSCFFRFIDRLIYKQYAAVSAITPEVKDSVILKLRYPSKKTYVIYNGINIDFIKNAQPYRYEDFFEVKNMVLLIQVSRFQSEKDQPTVIRSLTFLPSKYVLLLVGDGELRPECLELVKSLNLEERVKFLGVRMDIPRLLKTADIVVQSSNWEGFGLAAVEGMAAGKPVIASNVDGLKDIVENYGLVFARGNERELAEKILSLEDKQYYNKIANKCLLKSHEFKIDEMVESFISLYKSIIFCT